MARPMGGEAAGGGKVAFAAEFRADRDYSEAQAWRESTLR